MSGPPSRNVLPLYFYHVVWKGRTRSCVPTVPCCMLCIECQHLGVWQCNWEDCPCAIALSCCNGAGCGEKCWVNCSCIVQEGTNKILDVFDLFWGEWLCGVDLHPLNSCAILDWGCLVGSMLGRNWFGVLVLREGLIDIAGHVAINMFWCIVPGELYATKKRTHHATAMV